MHQIPDAEALSNIIRRSGANPTLAWRVLWHVTSALLEMHNHGLVHRDVWSENILVDSSGNSYLIDFGCTESVRNYGNRSTDTGLNIPYLSPQVSQKDPPAKSDDMWALGLVITEVVTGRHVIFRMGRHDVPFYTQAEHLQTALEETAAQGGLLLGQIAQRLLDNDARSRATAAEVLNMCGSTGQPTRSSIVSVVDQSGSRRPSGSGVEGLPAMQSISGVAASTGGTASNGMGITAGQEVVYQASSHNAFYRGTVVGRSAGNNAWLVKLTGGGTKEVPDSEIWRITPKVPSRTYASASDDRPSPVSTQQLQSPVGTQQLQSFAGISVTPAAVTPFSNFGSI